MAKLAVCLLLASTASITVANDVSGCIMSNTGAINDVVDTALFIYASAKSCEAGETANGCVANIASVVNSALGVGEFMVKVFKTCGEIKTTNYDCGLAGTSLAATLASITGNTALAAADCKSHDSMAITGKYGHFNWTYAGLDVCTINVGAAMSGLQAAITSMMTVKSKCDAGKGGKCFSAVLDIISAVGNLAVFIENVVANCNHDNVAVTNACGTDVGGILSGLAATASTAITIKSKCTPESTLYQDSESVLVPTRNGGANVLTGMLVIFLPFTGLASYYGGAKLKDREARVAPIAQVEI